MIRVLLLSSLLGLAPLAAGAATTKLGYVDLSRVLKDSKAAQTERVKLESTLKERQTVLDAEKAKIDALRAVLEKSEKTLPKAEKDAKGQEIIDRTFAYQKLVAEARKEVGEADQVSTRLVTERMKAVLAKLGQAKGLDLVVEKNAAAILFARDGIDLTDEVIRLMDAVK